MSKRTLKNGGIIYSLNHTLDELFDFLIAQGMSIKNSKNTKKEITYIKKEATPMFLEWLNSIAPKCCNCENLNCILYSEHKETDGNIFCANFVGTKEAKDEIKKLKIISKKKCKHKYEQIDTEIIINPVEEER